MDYDDARPQIQDGDLIGVLDVHGLLGRATTFFTRSPYTHTGVAVWLGEHLFMADLNSGRNHLTALSCVKKFDVFAPPAGMPRDLISRAALDWLASPINYGVLAFLAIGLKCFLRLKVFIHWRQIVVCSGGSVEIYQRAAALARAERGLIFPTWEDHNQMISPGELCGEMSKKFSVGY